MRTEIILYVLCLLIIQLPLDSYAKCLKYYTMLERKEIAPGQFEVRPRSLNDLYWSYPFNTTEEYNILTANMECVIDLTCSIHPTDTNTTCVSLYKDKDFTPEKVKNTIMTETPQEGSDIHPNVTEKKIIAITEEAITLSTATQVTGVTEKNNTESHETNTNEVSDINANVTEIYNIATTEEAMTTSTVTQVTGVTEKNNTESYKTSSGGNVPEATTVSKGYTTTEPTDNQSSDKTTTPTSDPIETTKHPDNTNTTSTKVEDKTKTEVLIHVAIAMGTLAVAAILIWLLYKGVGIIQSGTYILSSTA